MRLPRPCTFLPLIGERSPRGGDPDILPGDGSPLPLPGGDPLPRPGGDPLPLSHPGGGLFPLPGFAPLPLPPNKTAGSRIDDLRP